MAEFDAQYVHLVREGLSRVAIEARLAADGIEDVGGFWQAIAHQALLDACDPTQPIDQTWRRLYPFQYFEPNYALPPVASPKTPGTGSLVHVS